LGQDVLRLGASQGASNGKTHSVLDVLPLCGVGSAIDLASPWTESHGWVAVSDHSYRLTGAEGGWKWLPENYQRVGKSIRL